MFYLVFKLFVTFVLSAPNCTATSKNNFHRNFLIRNTNLRVFYGRDIREGEYPYVVVILIQVSHHNTFYRTCTGSIISKNWVISAGHCVYQIETDRVFVWYGNHTVSPHVTKMYRRVLDIVVYPKYRDISNSILNDVGDNDLSLLRVSKIYIQSYGRLSAADYSTLVGLPMTYVGGGETDRFEDDELLPLQVGEAAVIPCSNEFRENVLHLICVAHRCGTRSTSGAGDSGGPLIYGNRIVGVLSYGMDAIDGYTPVSSYLDWILKVTSTS